VLNGFNAALDTVNTKIGEWNEGFFYILPNLIVALGVALIFVAMAFALSNLVRKVVLRARRRDLSAMLSSFVFWLTMLLGTLVVLTIVLPSMKPADIFASLESARSRSGLPSRTSCRTGLPAF
jgi:hypothetical protein